MLKNGLIKICELPNKIKMELKEQPLPYRILVFTINYGIYVVFLLIILIVIAYLKGW